MDDMSVIDDKSSVKSVQRNYKVSEGLLTSNTERTSAPAVTFASTSGNALAIIPVYNQPLTYVVAGQSIAPE